MPVEFHFKIPKFYLQKNSIITWIKNCIIYYNYIPGNLNIIFISSIEIIELNKKYLNHNYETDILTFNYNDKNIINGDIFICIKQVKTNAIEYNTSFENEVNRVIIHGILHLIGFDDSNKTLTAKMRDEEDFWLNKL